LKHRWRVARGDAVSIVRCTSRCRAPHSTSNTLFRAAVVVARISTTSLGPAPAGIRTNPTVSRQSLQARIKRFRCFIPVSTDGMTTSAGRATALLGALSRVKPRSPPLFSITNVGFEFVKPKLCSVFFPRAIAMRESRIARQAAADFGRDCLQMRAHDRVSQTRPSRRVDHVRHLTCGRRVSGTLGVSDHPHA
jgi:hypothetical protein